MNVSLMRTICCPLCKSDLSLHRILAETTSLLSPEARRGDDGTVLDGESNGVIREGLLLCSSCRVWYPISSYIPVLLVFQTPFHAVFRAQQEAVLAAFPGYSPPNGEARPGERSIQSTFTDEWDDMHQDDLSFTYSDDDLRALNEHVWLKWASRQKLMVRQVLNVGCGLGRESIAIANALDGAEIVAVDLNFALLRSGPLFKTNRGLHLIIASLFQLPLRGEAFDLVYTQGVIHHTFSTRKALEAIAQFVKPGGYLFVWVYGLDDHLVRRGLAGALSRLSYASERVLRPMISGSPKTVRDFLLRCLSVAAHPFIKSRVIHKNSWRLRNTDHDLRDWLSPRYAHRHSYNELFEWFDDLGLEVVDVQSPAAYLRLFNKRLWGVGLTGQRHAQE